MKLYSIIHCRKKSTRYDGKEKGRYMSMERYAAIKRDMIRGWNTWNTRSVLSHVLMPDGFAINLGIKEYCNGHHLCEALIGRQGCDDEIIHPGLHAYDGSYTSLNLKWRNIELDISSATAGDDLILLIEPIRNQLKPAALIIEMAMLWNKPGTLQNESGYLKAHLTDREVVVYVEGKQIEDLLVNTKTPYLSMELSQTVYLSTGKRRSLEEVKQIIEENRIKLLKSSEKYGDLAEAYRAMQTCMAWDTIYEPQKDRVVTPVSRIWNIDSGGYVLFCWDNYFAAYMASVEHKGLAYSNAIEITREKTENGFVPNLSYGTGVKSNDRSQPPVGAMVVNELYKKYGDQWLLEELFDDLWGWNKWFYENRRMEDGTFAWGSDPYTPFAGNQWEQEGVNDRYGAALESGLDNSPMYDDVPFDKAAHLLSLSDVGLTSLYIMDCRNLSEIAHVLGKENEKCILAAHIEETECALEKLWSEEFGLYLNKRSDTGEWSYRISPTNFYALFSDKVSDEHIERMIDEHFYNPEEFWGEWMMPSISRNDAAYPDQDYWRGRIWAPMNFLVYLAMRRYQNEKVINARKSLKEKSVKLILKEWLEHGHVHENYSGDTGEGCNVKNSDRFYHWGGLLAMLAIIEEGYM